MKSCELSELNRLSKKYQYDMNHNLRYIALRDLILKLGIQEICVLGCGLGIVEYLLPDSVCCLSYDIDEQAITIAQQINAGKRNREFRVQNILTIECEKHRLFQAVLISEVLEHLPENKDEMALKIAQKLLNSNGILLLAVPNLARLINHVRRLMRRPIIFMSKQHLREYTLEQVQQLLHRCGYSVVHWEPVYLRLPKETLFRHILGIDHPLRRLVLRLNLRLATYLVFVAKKSASSGHQNSAALL